MYIRARLKIKSDSSVDPVRSETLRNREGIEVKSQTQILRRIALVSNPAGFL